MYTNFSYALLVIFGWDYKKFYEKFFKNKKNKIKIKKIMFTDLLYGLEHLTKTEQVKRGLAILAHKNHYLKNN